MKILVTGAAGLIGRAVVDRLVREGHDVVAVVRKPVLPDPGSDLRLAGQEFVGDAADPKLLHDAMEGVRAVVHLAAIPAPVGRTARELLQANAVTTMAVLEAAADRGVSTAVIASSISILGMAWSEDLMHPIYVPVDEDHPLRPTEGYALSKEDDEAAARMASRRWGMSVLALRFPFTGTPEMISERAAAIGRDGSEALAAAKELWGYLDLRDAARAVSLSIAAAESGRVAGSVVLNIVADDALGDRPLRSLLNEWHPGARVDSENLRGAYATERAKRIIGFEARHLGCDPS